MYTGFKNFYLALFSGLLLFAAWYGKMQILIFFGFAPLLWVEHALSSSSAPKRKLKVFALSYVAFLVWNVGVTWWIIRVQFGKPGAVMAWVANALLMAIVFLIFSNIKKRIGKDWAVWLLIPLWLAWEYLHSVWDLAWIWLTLGNVFAYQHNWIQWYELTGTSGGSLWILVVNILVFILVKDYSKGFRPKSTITILTLIIVPIALSYLILALRKPLNESGKKFETVIVQPNIDPYNEKFAADYQSQFFKALSLIKGQLSEKTEYLVLPETFITGAESVYGVNEENADSAIEIKWFRDSLINKYPQLKIIVGASSYLVYRDEKAASVTARKHQSGVYFDCYNTAIQIDHGKVQLYHKSKLVPGVEKMPFPRLMKPLENLALDLGGTSGSLGVQDERTSFEDKKDSVGVAPVVCYESVFSDYVTEYIRKGASFIFIITNDGWWDDSPGYVDHLNYARLRAIENRRQIARSANTGVSCFLDEFGNIYQPTKYWTEAVIKQDVVPNHRLTFFSRFGDIISYTAVVITVFLLFFSQYLRFKNRNSAREKK
jgi:apolipoprotein N-acyltransferase